MGASKPLLDLGGRTLLARAVCMANEVAPDCSVIGPPELLKQTTARVADDLWPGCGPLGGIATALSLRFGEQAAEWNLILACDMPYITVEWLRYLVGRAQASPDADVVMAATERGCEPLCSVVRSACGAAVINALERGIRKVTDGLAGLHVQLIEPREWKCFDSSGCLFNNVNTQEDYAAAKRHFDKMGGEKMRVCPDDPH